MSEVSYISPLAPEMEIQIACSGSGSVDRRFFIAGLHFGNERVLQADMDLFGCGSGFKKTGNLVVALFLRSLGESRIFGGCAGFLRQWRP